MKRFISIILISIMGAALCLGGCGTEWDTGEEEEIMATDSLEVWICYDRNVPGAYYVFQWDTLAEKYGYEIEIQTYSEQEIKDKLKMAVVCNELPDIFYVPGGTYPEYLFEAGACMPVQDYLSEAGFQEKYVMPFEDGNNYIIPCMADSYVAAYYNTELMDEIGLEVPSDWEELEEMIQKVNQYNREHGTDYAAIELGMKDKWMGELLYCITALSQDPERYREMETGIFPQEDIFLEASEAIQELIDSGAFPKEYMEIGEPEAVRNFINRDAVMMVHQTSLVYHLIQNMGREGFEAAAFPGCCSSENGKLMYHLMDMNYTYIPGLAVSSVSPHKEVAAELCVEFAQEVNRINVEELGYLNISDENFVYDGSTFPQLDFIHDLEKNSETTDVFLLSVYNQEDGDEWGNLFKQFFAGQMDAGTFSWQSIEIIKK